LQQRNNIRLQQHLDSSKVLGFYSRQRRSEDNLAAETPSPYSSATEPSCATAYALRVPVAVQQRAQPSRRYVQLSPAGTRKAVLHPAIAVCSALSDLTKALYQWCHKRVHTQPFQCQELAISSFPPTYHLLVVPFVLHAPRSICCSNCVLNTTTRQLQ
jgi:hypothetical protein